MLKNQYFKDVELVLPTDLLFKAFLKMVFIYFIFMTLIEGKI